MARGIAESDASLDCRCRWIGHLDAATPKAPPVGARIWRVLGLDEEPYRKAARESGADAFLRKKTAAAELVSAIGALVSAFPVKPKREVS